MTYKEFVQYAYHSQNSPRDFVALVLRLALSGNLDRFMMDETLVVTSSMHTIVSITQKYTAWGAVIRYQQQSAIKALLNCISSEALEGALQSQLAFMAEHNAQSINHIKSGLMIAECYLDLDNMCLLIERVNPLLIAKSEIVKNSFVLHEKFVLTVSQRIRIDKALFDAVNCYFPSASTRERKIYKTVIQKIAARSATNDELYNKSHALLGSIYFNAYSVGKNKNQKLFHHAVECWSKVVSPVGINADTNMLIGETLFSLKANHLFVNKYLTESQLKAKSLLHLRYAIYDNKNEIEQDDKESAIRFLNAAMEERERMPEYKNDYYPLNEKNYVKIIVSLQQNLITDLKAYEKDKHTGLFSFLSKLFDKTKLNRERILAINNLIFRLYQDYLHETNLEKSDQILKNIKNNLIAVFSFGESLNSPYIRLLKDIGNINDYLIEANHYYRLNEVQAKQEILSVTFEDNYFVSVLPETKKTRKR